MIRVSETYQRLLRLSQDARSVLFNKNVLPVKYYTKAPNVGDLLNPYLIPEISGRVIAAVQTERFTHLIPIGSLIGQIGSKSVVWGAGSIDGKTPRKGFKKGNIYALRGYRTLQMLEDSCGEKINVPLGDPALLMPHFFEPQFSKEFTFGIIPHHSEKDILDTIRDARMDNVRAIDVSLAPEKFVTELAKCEFIFSSSLHGLILSDCYGIKNAWVSFSERLKGGAWKFHDYYSTTNAKSPSQLHIDSLQGFLKALGQLSFHARVNASIVDPSLVLDAFPAHRF